MSRAVAARDTVPQRSPTFPIDRTRLAPLAGAWLDAGATGFGLWLGDEALEYWPAGQAPAAPDVTAGVPGAGSFRLGVSGVNPASRARLEADASILGDLASVESDIEAMTSQLVERHDELLALYELIRSTRSQLDLQLTLGTLAQQMAKLLKASLGFAMVTTHDDRYLFAATPPGWIDAETVASLVADVQGGRGRDILLPPRVFAGRPTGRPRHVLALPVKVAKAVAGIGVGRERSAFTATEVKLAHAIAEQVGAYIDNALFHHDSVVQARLETEMKMAAEVQRHLLPRSWPSAPGLDLFASAKPASAVGGDFYDVLPDGDDHVFLALGDVTGKGAAAALVMSMAHAALRSAVRVSGCGDPAQVLRHAIASLYDDFDGLGMYATAFLGCYHVPSREVRFVSAGHSPVIYRPRGGPSELLTPEEPPIGMLDSCSSQARAVRLEPGDVLVVATDGFNEARDPDGGWFGTDRLLAVVDESAALTAAGLEAAVSEAVRRFQRGREPDDDQTLVVLKGTPAGGE